MGHALKIEGGRGWQQAVQEIKENRRARRGLGRAGKKKIWPKEETFLFSNLL
jgi:hypothetical protein